MNRNFLFAFVVFRIAAKSALAAGPFSGLVVFGDSLSDVGNVQQRTTELAPLVQPIPGPYYFNGRFSNGQNYAEVLSQGLGFGPSLAALRGEMILPMATRSPREQRFQILSWSTIWTIR